MSESTENVSAKKFKRIVKFNKQWLKKYTWLRKGHPTGSGIAICTACNNISFSIGHGGEHDIRRHMNSNTHKNIITISATSSKMTSFLV